METENIFGDDIESAAQLAVPLSHGSDQSRRGSKRKQEESSIVDCKFAPRKKCKVESFLQSVSNDKQEVSVQVKAERGVTVFCSQRHDVKIYIYAIYELYIGVVAIYDW